MALSEELKHVYSNYSDNRMYYDTIQLYHPNFNVTADDPYPKTTNYPSAINYPSEINYIQQSYFLIRDIESQALQIEDGSTQNFEAYPFNVIPPQVGEEQQDIGIVLDNVSLEIIKGIELAAENTAVPIEMTYRVYMEGSVESQITPITLALTEVVVDMFTVSCKASRVDMYARNFPFGNRTYFLSNFEGLTI